jgi:hypothetical protein
MDFSYGTVGRFVGLIPSGGKFTGWNAIRLSELFGSTCHYLSTRLAFFVMKRTVRVLQGDVSCDAWHSNQRLAVPPFAHTQQ